MISLFLLFVAVVLAIEIARRLPLLQAFAGLARLSARIPRILGYRRCLEERKERAVQMLACALGRRSLLAGAMLVAVAAPILLVLLIDSFAHFGVAVALLDWRMRGALLLLCIVYAISRSRFSRRLRAR